MTGGLCHTGSGSRVALLPAGILRVGAWVWLAAFCGGGDTAHAQSSDVATSERLFRTCVSVRDESACSELISKYSGWTQTPRWALARAHVQRALLREARGEYVAAYKDLQTAQTVKFSRAARKHLRRLETAIRKSETASAEAGGGRKDAVTPSAKAVGGQGRAGRPSSTARGTFSEDYTQKLIARARRAQKRSEAQKQRRALPPRVFAGPLPLRHPALNRLEIAGAEISPVKPAGTDTPGEVAAKRPKPSGDDPDASASSDQQKTQEEAGSVTAARDLADRSAAGAAEKVVAVSTPVDTAPQQVAEVEGEAPSDGGGGVGPFAFAVDTELVCERSMEGGRAPPGGMRFCGPDVWQSALARNVLSNLFDRPSPVAADVASLPDDGARDVPALSGAELSPSLRVQTVKIAQQGRATSLQAVTWDGGKLATSCVLSGPDGLSLSQVFGLKMIDRAERAGEYRLACQINGVTRRDRVTGVFNAAPARSDIIAGVEGNAGQAVSVSRDSAVIALAGPGVQSGKALVDAPSQCEKRLSDLEPEAHRLSVQGAEQAPAIGRGLTLRWSAGAAFERCEFGPRDKLASVERSGRAHGLSAGLQQTFILRCTRCDGTSRQVSHAVAALKADTVAEVSVRPLHDPFEPGSSQGWMMPLLATVMIVGAMVVLFADVGGLGQMAPAEGDTTVTTDRPLKKFGDMRTRHDEEADTDPDMRPLYVRQKEASLYRTAEGPAVAETDSVVPVQEVDHEALAAVAEALPLPGATSVATMDVRAEEAATDEAVAGHEVVPAEDEGWDNDTIEDHASDDALDVSDEPEFELADDDVERSDRPRTSGLPALDHARPFFGTAGAERGVYALNTAETIQPEPAVADVAAEFEDFEGVAFADQSDGLAEPPADALAVHETIAPPTSTPDPEPNPEPEPDLYAYLADIPPMPAEAAAECMRSLRGASHEGTDPNLLGAVAILQDVPVPFAEMQVDSFLRRHGAGELIAALTDQKVSASEAPSAFHLVSLADAIERSRMLAQLPVFVDGLALLLSSRALGDRTLDARQDQVGTAVFSSVRDLLLQEPSMRYAQDGLSQAREVLREGRDTNWTDVGSDAQDAEQRLHDAVRSVVSFAELFDVDMLRFAELIEKVLSRALKPLDGLELGDNHLVGVDQLYCPVPVAGLAGDGDHYIKAILAELFRGGSRITSPLLSLKETIRSNSRNLADRSRGDAHVDLFDETPLAQVISAQADVPLHTFAQSSVTWVADVLGDQRAGLMKHILDGHSDRSRFIWDQNGALVSAMTSGQPMTLVGLEHSLVDRPAGLIDFFTIHEVAVPEGRSEPLEPSTFANVYGELLQALLSGFRDAKPLTKHQRAMLHICLRLVGQHRQPTWAGLGELLSGNPVADRFDKRDPVTLARDIKRLKACFRGIPRAERIGLDARVGALWSIPVFCELFDRKDSGKSMLDAIKSHPLAVFEPADGAIDLTQFALLLTRAVSERNVAAIDLAQVDDGFSLPPLRQGAGDAGTFSDGKILVGVETGPDSADLESDLIISHGSLPEGASGDSNVSGDRAMAIAHARDPRTGNWLPIYRGQSAS